MSNVQKILNLYRKGKISKSTIIKAAAFKKEINGLLEKTAVNPAQVLLYSALAGPAFAASNYFAGKGMSLIEDKLKEDARENEYERILEMRPELKDLDQLLVKKYFDSLKYFAPAIAADPLAAGAYIKQAIQYEEVGGPPYSTIESLVKTQKTFSEAMPSGVSLSTMMLKGKH